MGMAALRHALARNVGNRKRIALQHRDAIIEVRKRTSRQQARHARADHNRMFADRFMVMLPARCLLRAPADTGPGLARFSAGMRRQVTKMSGNG